MKKQQLFVFANSPTVHHTSTLHNFFYFKNTWRETHLQSDPVSMQPGKTECHPQRLIKMYGLQDAEMHAEDPPLNNGTLLLHWRLTTGYWNSWSDVRFSHHKVACISWCSEANIHCREGKMWWFIDIYINYVVYNVFGGCHELNGDWKLCRCQMIARYFWMHHQYDNL